MRHPSRSNRLLPLIASRRPSAIPPSTRLCAPSSTRTCANCLAVARQRASGRGRRLARPRSSRSYNGRIARTFCSHAVETSTGSASGHPRHATVREPLGAAGRGVISRARATVHSSAAAGTASNGSSWQSTSARAGSGVGPSAQQRRTPLDRGAQMRTRAMRCLFSLSLGPLPHPHPRSPKPSPSSSPSPFLRLDCGLP